MSLEASFPADLNSVNFLICTLRGHIEAVWRWYLDGEELGRLTELCKTFRNRFALYTRYLFWPQPAGVSISLAQHRYWESEYQRFLQLQSEGKTVCSRPRFWNIFPQIQ